MKKIFLCFVVGAFILAGCDKNPKNENEFESFDRQVVISFTAKSLSNSMSKSAASTAENSIEQIILFGVNGKGEVVQNFPVFENPNLSGTAVFVSSSVKSFYVIANPSAEMEASNPSTVADLEAMTCDFANAPQAPFVMSSIGELNGNSINLELVRTVAKIDVISKDDFQVESVTVMNTPAKGYVFDNGMPAFDMVNYSESSSSSVYVAENGSQNPTKLFVKGTFQGKFTAYTIVLSNDGIPMDIVRNTCYQVSVTPITESECNISVSIPEWNDAIADETFIPNFGTYMIADFHQHTAYTDGANPIDFVLNQALKYGLDINVNSEHGGAFNGNASEGDYEGACPTWIASGLTPLDFKGDVNGSGVSQNMWRWQSIKEYSFKKVWEFNQRGTSMLAIQGLEWNPPGHEHCSSGIITEQFFTSNPNANAMAQFEYMFDANDRDETGGNEFGWVKSTKSGKEKTMDAAAWLQKNHRYTSWLIPAHPERQNGWNISDYRNLNDIAPDVFIAFESIPGHQASPNRGGIGNSSSYGRSYTYGGVGIQAAKVGGLWDAMISEGRRFWLVANSDFHNHVTKGSDDFYPGEYQKTYVSMRNKTAQSFVDGLRSGNIFTVHGDLIDRLEFSVGSATMGETFRTKNSVVKVRILVRDPETSNHNTYTSLTNPVLDHIDLIAGEMRPKIAKGAAEYEVGEYDNVKVIARFDANGGVTDANGITSIKWQDLGSGLKLVEYTVQITGDTYFRLRGTNHGLNVAGKTDANGNPLEDQPSANVLEGAKVAFEDLWFYSNPIFVRK